MAADIVSTVALDATALKQGFDAALKSARAFRNDIDKTLEFKPLQNAIKASREFKDELARITAREVQELNQNIAETNEGLNESVTAAREAASSVQETARAAEAAGDGFETVDDRIRNTLLALEEWQRSGDRTEESFNRIKQAALDMFDAALAEAAGDQALELEILRKEIEALTFAQVQAVWATEEIEDAVKKYRYATLSLYNDVRQGLVTQEEGIRLARELKAEINEAATQTEHWSKEYYGLSVAAGRAESILAQLEGRVTAVGHAKSVQVGTTHLLTQENNALAASYQRVGQAITAALTAAGLTRFLRTLRNVADDATTAETHVRLFYSEAANAGQLNAAIRLLGDLRRELNLTQGELGEAGAALLNVGLNVRQAGELIRAGAALAERSNRPLAEGIDAVTRAMVLGRREALASLGVRIDFTRAINQARTAQDGSTRSLTEQQEAVVRYGEILRVAAGDVERFGEGQEGFSRAVTRFDTAMKRFREVTGEGARTFLRPLLGLLGRAIELFSNLPSPIRTAALGITLLGTAVAGLGAAYFTLRAVLAKTQIVQTAVNALVANEALLRTRLGTALVGLAARYKLLTREQLVNNAATIRASKGMTLTGVASNVLVGGVKRAVTAVRALTTASLRFAATPIGIVILAIGAAVALLTTAVRRNREVLEPAFQGMRNALQAVQNVLQPLIRSFTRLFEEGTVLSNFIRSTLIAVALSLGLTILALARAAEAAALAFRFLQEMHTEGIRAAWRNYQESAQELTRRYQDLEGQIWAAARAAWAGEEAMDDFSEAVEDAGEDAEELAKRVKAAEETLTGFQNRFRGMRIDLMEDGVDKDIAKVREEFRLLRNEIRKAAEENDQFKPFEAGLIADAFELEQQEILRIQKDYSDKRMAEAEKQAKELAKVIRERERAIVDEQTRGRLNEADALTLAYQRRVEDTEAVYSELIADAKKFGRDTTNLERLRVKELLAIQEGYERDVSGVYERIYESIAEQQRELVRAAAEARGDTYSLAGIDFDAESREIDRRYAEWREQAADNAELLAEIDASELEARAAARLKHWNEIMRITKEGADTITTLEEGLARERAELAGDQVGLLRLGAAAELREIHKAYDEAVAAAQGNAADIVRINELRNQAVELANERLANSLRDLADSDLAAGMKLVVEGLTADLDEATDATLASVEQQLLSWRSAYADNGEIVAFVNEALDKVQGRYEELADEAAKNIDDIVKSTKALTEGIFTDEARRDLSDMDGILFDAARKAAELAQNQERISQALAAAVGEHRDELLRAAQETSDALESINRQIMADARRLTQSALEEYQAGLNSAKADASRAAVDLVTSDVRTVIGRLTSLQTDAIASARTSLLRAIATLTTQGVDTAALEPLRAQIRELDELMAGRARATADFATGQMNALRDVAEATLDETTAQKIAQATLTETIRLRKEALAEAQREGASIEELATLTERVTDAQLEYVGNLQAQITTLQGLKGEYTSVFSSVRDLADLLNRPIPTAVIEAQRNLALASLQNVRSAQDAGQSYADYNDQLTEALGLWREYQTASTQSIKASAEEMRKARLEDPLTLPSEQRVHELAARISEAYQVGTDEAKRIVMNFALGLEDDLFRNLELRDPLVLSEIFDGLNQSAAETPDVLAGIDAEIESLTTRVEDLKNEIAEAIDFTAAGQQLLSGYKSVLEQAQVVTEESFDAAAGRAVTAFLERYEAESNRLREELEDTLGSVAEAAGLTAGEGLMTAFAQGITNNRQALLNAVESILRQVREMLPSSDAKRGPLSDLTHSGKMLPLTLMKGAMSQQRALQAGMSRLLAGLTPSAAFTTSTAPSLMGGLTPAQINNYFEGAPTQAPGQLDREARRFGQLAAREATAQLRMRGRRR